MPCDIGLTGRIASKGYTEKIMGGITIDKDMHPERFTLRGSTEITFDDIGHKAAVCAAKYMSAIAWHFGALDSSKPPALPAIAFDFVAFENGEDSVNFTSDKDDFSIENHLDRISLFGKMTITKETAGKARALAALFSKIAVTIRDKKTAAKQEPPPLFVPEKVVSNPFVSQE